MKLWSSLFTSAIVVVGITACAMDPQEQRQDEGVGHVSQALCKSGTTCYDGTSSGTLTQQTFSCPLSLPKGGCGLHLMRAKEDLDDDPNTVDYECYWGCDGSGDGYGTYYNPCPLFKIYSCTPYGYCTCH